MNRSIITAEESALYLSFSTEWVALDDDTMERHISLACVYMQSEWQCDGLDWNDSTAIPDEMKEACAYYALASFSGNLYTSADETVEQKGNIIEETDVLGPLESTLKYSDSGVASKSSVLQYPNTLMSIYCSSKRLSGAVWAVRT